ncbi:MAG: hypothetical protein GY765_20365 [bacterium]|nr:hypothetical protein [bacterium]
MDTKKKKDNTMEIRQIKERIDARTVRKDCICWNCRKGMPNKTKRCLYCGEEQ